MGHLASLKPVLLVSRNPALLEAAMKTQLAGGWWATRTDIAGAEQCLDVHGTLAAALVDCAALERREGRAFFARLRDMGIPSALFVRPRSRRGFIRELDVLTIAIGADAKIAVDRAIDAFRRFPFRNRPAPP